MIITLLLSGQAVAFICSMSASKHLLHLNPVLLPVPAVQSVDLGCECPPKRHCVIYVSAMAPCGRVSDRPWKESLSTFISVVWCWCESHQMCVRYQYATEHASARHHHSVECRCLPFSLLTQAAPFLGATWQYPVRDIAYRAGEPLPKE